MSGKASLFNKGPLSRVKIQRGVENLAKDANEHDRLHGCTYFSVALDESTDTDTAQLLVNVRAVNTNFEITQELARLA